MKTFFPVYILSWNNVFSCVYNDVMCNFMLLVSKDPPSLKVCMFLRFTSMAHTVACHMV